MLTLNAQEAKRKDGVFRKASFPFLCCTNEKLICIFANRKAPKSVSACTCFCYLHCRYTWMLCKQLSTLPHSKINISLEWFSLNVTRLFFFCLCHQKLHLLHEIFTFLSYQPIGGTKNNNKSDILCLADTLWAKSGSGCPAIP